MGASLRGSSSLNRSRTAHNPRYGDDRRRKSRSRSPKNDPFSSFSTQPQVSWNFQAPTTPMGIPIPFPVYRHHHASSEHFRVVRMERNPSNSSILSSSETPPSELRYRQPNTLPLLADSQAAQGVEDRLQRLSPHRSSHARILRKLIDRTDPLDNRALAGILTAVDSVFFGGALKGRVQWEWSSESPYHNDLVGTSALRECVDERGGIETLIVLSEPILTDSRYDRRLVLSVFLHELIHCYLFVSCGWMARVEGGHTDGFHRIARVIDDWVGRGELRLCSMLANLSFFQRRDVDHGHEEATKIEAWNSTGCVKQGHGHEGCNQSPRYEREYYDDSHRFESGYGFHIN